MQKRLWGCNDDVPCLGDKRGGWLQMFTLWELIEIVRAPAHVPSAEEQIMLDSVQG